MAESHFLHTNSDPLQLADELTAALEQPELSVLEDGGEITAPIREAAVALATALGQCRLFGVELPEDLDGTLPLRTATAAAEGLVERLRRDTEDARALGPRWDQATDQVEEHDLVCGLLEARMDAWAALLAVEEASLAAQEDGEIANASEQERKRFGEAVEAMIDALADFDNALEDEKGLLSVAADTNILDNWRASLAPEHSQPLPWWLDGTLEEEGDRAYKEVLEWMSHVEQRARLSRLHSTPEPAILPWRPVVSPPTLLAAAEAAAEDQPFAPPLYWQSPDGRYEARLIFPPRLACPADEPLGVYFERVEDQKPAVELAGEPIRLGDLPLTIDDQGRAAFVLSQLPDSESPPELRVGASATPWTRLDI